MVDAAGISIVMADVAEVILGMVDIAQGENDKAGDMSRLADVAGHNLIRLDS